MKTYLLSAFGVIFFSVLVSFLIPEGKLNKLIVFVVRVICIAVIIQPVTELFHRDAATTESELCDYEAVCAVYSDWQSRNLEEKLREQFGVESECSIEIVYSDGQFGAESVRVSTNVVESEINEKIYAYLEDCGYINITVNDEIV